VLSGRSAFLENVIANLFIESLGSRATLPLESEWAQQERAARTRLHDAWERNSAERSRESLEALKAAQAELQKLEDASPYKDIEW